METNEKNRRRILCIEEQKKLSCVFIQLLKLPLAILFALRLRLSRCPAKRRKNARRGGKTHARDGEIFYYCCGLFAGTSAAASPTVQNPPAQWTHIDFFRENFSLFDADEICKKINLLARYSHVHCCF